MEENEPDVTPELLDKWRHIIQVKSGYDIVIEGKVVTIPMPHDIVDEKISRLMDEIKFSPEPKTEREKKRLSRKSRSLGAKCAAIILLNRLCYIPFIYSIYWRWIRFSKTPKYISGIINCGFIKETEIFFYLNYTAISNHCEFQSIKKMMEQK